MVNQRRFSLSFVVFFPLVLFIVVMLVTTKNYYDAVNRYIDTEYSRIDRALTRGIKVLTALDYSFTNYSNFANPLSEEHNSIVKGDICYIWPIDVLLLENVYSDGLPAVDVDYMIVGEKVCVRQGRKSTNLQNKKQALPLLCPSFMILNPTLLVSITSINVVM